MSGKMEMLRTGTHILYLLSIEESCKKPCSYQCQQQAHFLTEMKKKEMPFNLHPLLYAENKGSFQFKWSIQGKERLRETDREEEGK